MTVHASSEDQKDQRYKLSASPYETAASLLDKAVKRFNRTHGMETGNLEEYVLKVLYACTRVHTYLIVHTYLHGDVDCS